MASPRHMDLMFSIRGTGDPGHTTNMTFKSNYLRASKSFGNRKK